MNEAETCAEHIDPALRAAGWVVVEGSRIRREFPLTLGRIEGVGHRGKTLTADYILEYRPKSPAMTGATAALVVDKQAFPGFVNEHGTWHFLFSRKDTKIWICTLRSTLPELDGQSGSFTSRLPTLEQAKQPSIRFPNWWTDDPDPAAAIGLEPGARHISRWREAFLRDFAARLERCRAPAVKIPGA